MTNFKTMTTDQLLEKMPDNLMLMKNENAPDNDRYRIYNAFTKNTVKPGFSTAKALLIHTLQKIEDQSKEWTGR